eukprot:scaffold23126_cov241-Isochrysis_galbana.AAC.7
MNLRLGLYARGVVVCVCAPCPVPPAVMCMSRRVCGAAGAGAGGLRALLIRLSPRCALPCPWWRCRTGAQWRGCGFSNKHGGQAPPD